MPAVPPVTACSACVAIAATPRRSISFIVYTCTPELRTRSFSRSSRLRTPTSAVCCGRTVGEKPPIDESSAGSGPSSAASGMPCTLPLGVLAGVFMSPCASTHRSPSGLPAARACAADRRHRSSAQAVIAAEHQRNRAFFDRRARGLVQAVADFGDLLDELLPGIAVLSRFGDGRRQIAAIDDDASQRRNLFPEPGNAEGGRSHVDATAAAAHVERNADEVDRGGHGGTISKEQRAQSRGQKSFQLFALGSAALTCVFQTSRCPRRGPARARLSSAMPRSCRRRIRGARRS